MNRYDVGDAALSELHEDGRPGRAFGELLYGVTSAIARFGPFPPPSGGSSWTAADVTEVAHEFFADQNTSRRLATLAVTADSGRSLALQLEQAVKNYLRDQARKTERSHLTTRLRDVMDDERFVQQQAGTTRLWAIAEHAREPSEASDGDLARAAHDVHNLSVIRWSGRRGPVASRRDLARLLFAVLDAAGGTVTEDRIVEAVAARFGLRLDATTVALDDLAGFDPAAPEPTTRDGDRDASEAERLFAQLTERERIILANAALTDRELGDVIGLKSSAANVARARLVDTLREAFAELDDPEAVYGLVERFAVRWVRDRATEVGGTSKGSEPDD